MQIMAAICLFLSLIPYLFVVISASEDEKDFESKQFKIVERINDLYRTNSSFAQQFDQTFGHGDIVEKNSFHCTTIPPSPSIPTSVHKLRPGDISVIAALGDSLTAGRGASGGIIGLLIDYRGLSWSGGGDGTFEKTKTLANIFRLYNPNLYGYATGTGKRTRSRAKLNVAVTGDKSDTSLEQVKFLIERMRKDTNVDFDNDWKLITLFIGANDLCDFCKDREKYSVDNYIANVRDALDYMHANIPRAFINMVEVLNVEIVQEMGKNLLCDLIHIYACDCVARANKEETKEVIALRNSYQVGLRKLVASGRYDDKDDFTVVLQPFYRETFLPRTADGEVDMSYFASDCFHYSKKGQQASSAALWNNIFEPLASKRLNWTPEEALLCPSKDHPYLYTAKNSMRNASQVMEY